MNILITGGAGYIGSIIAERLIEEGHNISVIDNFSNSYRDNVPDDAFIYVADITCPTENDRATFEEAFECTDLVIHCAAIAYVDATMQNCMNINVMGGLNVLNEMVENDIRWIINSSSASVYGNKPDLIKESDLRLPVNYYGLSKLLFENILGYYRRIHSIQYTNFRYFNVAGATDKHGENRKTGLHLIEKALNCAIKDIPIEIYGMGGALRDYTHVADVADMIAKVVNRGPDNETINIGSGIATSINAVIDAVARVTEKHMVTDIRSPREEDAYSFIANNSKAKALYGYYSFYSLEDIVRSQWEWMNSPSYHSFGY